jgi:alpha-tubulin suppressor-like RCC1 family protein
MAYKLYAFGSNTHNQLGLPLGTDHTTLQDKIVTPTATFHKPRLEALRSIHGGAKHTLLLTMGGMAFGAGNNLDFQIALNETTTNNDDEDNPDAQHQATSGSDSGLEQQ